MRPLRRTSQPLRVRTASVQEVGRCDLETFGEREHVDPTEIRIGPCFDQPFDCLRHPRRETALLERSEAGIGMHEDKLPRRPPGAPIVR